MCVWLPMTTSYLIQALLQFIGIDIKTVLIKGHTEESTHAKTTKQYYHIYDLILTSAGSHVQWLTHRHLFTQHVSHVQQHIYTGICNSMTNYDFCALCPAPAEIGPRLMLTLNRMRRVYGKLMTAVC